MRLDFGFDLTAMKAHEIFTKMRLDFGFDLTAMKAHQIISQTF